MIPVPPGIRVWLATGHADMRKGFDGLALMVQETLKRDPHGGHLFVFRGRQAISSNVFGTTARGCACSPRGSSEAVSVAVDGRRDGDDLDRAAGLSARGH
jgi:transposase